MSHKLLKGVKFSFFSVNMENLVDEAKSHQGTLEHDVGPGSGKDDEDDELEALRLAAINSMRPKEKAEPPTDNETDPRGCPLYDAGFCPRGPACALSHVRRVICSNYVAGFCPEGPACRHAHPRLEVPAQDDSGEREAAKSDQTETTTPANMAGQALNSEESIQRHSRSRSSSKSR